MKVLGLITARGGSKGIPGKNIKPLLGKPLIVYTIDAAKKSGVLDRLILSTDDEAIRKVAEEHGCEVPFMRPKELATDTTAHLPVLQHAVNWLKEHEGYLPDAVMLLQPTSPACQAFHIHEAVEKLATHPEADSVISVAKVPEAYNSGKTMCLTGEYLRLMSGEPIYKRIPRRQDLSSEYWATGQYLFRTKLLFDREHPNFYGENTLPYEIDPKYVVDINEPDDWEFAEERLTLLQS